MLVTYVFSHSSLCCVELAVTSEPLEMERLEVVETVLEPTVVDAAEVVIVTNQLLTSDASDEAVES